MRNQPASSGRDLSSAIRGQVFPAHPFFPQLATASDPASMLDAFRRHLKPLTGKAFRIMECEPVRFRWSRSGSRCIVQYALRSDDLGERSSQFWVTGVIYAETGQAERAWEEERTTGHLGTIPEVLFICEPLALIADLQMLVRVFPYDRFLPNLPLVLSGPWPELHRQLLARFGPGNWRIEQQTVEPLRYLAEDSAVMRYSLHVRDAIMSRAETGRFYVKAYRTRHGEQTGQLLQQIRDGATDQPMDFSVVEPLAYCAERRCLVLAEAPGRSLRDVLLHAENPLTAVRRVAGAMARFNQSKITTARHQTAHEQITYLNRAADLLRWACPPWSPMIDRIVHHVTEALRDMPCVPIHWDLKTDHVFLDDERVTFVDLDTVSLGDPARDPAHLAAQIACRVDVPELPAELAQTAARALVDDYFSRVPASWREQLDQQYTIAMVESACGLFKRQEREWRERAAAAIREAESTLFGNVV